jgi:hypothetical protein
MKQHASTAITSLLVFLFAYTAVSKILDHQSFLSVLQQIPVISMGAGILAWAIPSAELCIVLLLLFKPTRLLALHCSSLLLIVFTIYLIYMVLSMQHLPCSCGGIISRLSWKQHIMLNIALIVLVNWNIYKRIAHTPALAEASASGAG